MNPAREQDPDGVRDAADALRRALVEDPLALAARLEDPIPVRDAAGGLDSWFVALTSGDLLLGFIQLEPDLELHRYSTFQRAPGSTDGCPPAALWLDRDAVLLRARTAADESDRLGEPLLGFHRTRDRLAWRVPVTNRPATIWVVGREVFTDAP